MASKDAGVTSTRPIGSVDPARQVPLPGSSGTLLASQAAVKSPPPPTPGALIGAGGPPSFPISRMSKVHTLSLDSIKSKIEGGKMIGQLLIPHREAVAVG